MEFLFQLEQKLLDPATRKNREELELLLAENFQEFGSSGRTYTRETTINLLAKEQSADILAKDFKSLELSADVVLVTYKTQHRQQGLTVSASLRSSIWKRIENKWQMVFHQGTKTEIS